MHGKIIKKNIILKKTHQKQPKRLIIFASGTGSNALNIIKFFKNDPAVQVRAVFCNKPNAKVLEKAKTEDVETFVFNKNDLYDEHSVLKKLQDLSPDLIVLAGFLLRIPDFIISSFKRKMINLHPSMLPKYGGKGMYGDHVHCAVLQNGEKESGISIHYVNPVYDDGQIIAQFKTHIDKNDTLDSLKAKIKNLEQKHFPETIDKIINDGQIKT